MTDAAPGKRKHLRTVEEDEAPRLVTDENRWQFALRRNEKGSPTQDPGNAALYLTHHPDWVGCISYDSFSDRVQWMKPSPSVGGLSGAKAGEQLQDEHWIPVAQWLAKEIGARFSKQIILDALEVAARRNERNTLRDYLTGLTWDGVVRLPTWLSTYLGAAQTDYTERVGKWWLISAAARGIKPGAQVDHMLVLEGPQGARKSTALRTLCPDQDWFLSKLPPVRDYERVAQAIQGRWLGEVGELDALRGAALTAVKEFLSLTTDTFRRPYARLHVTRKRTIVLAGTTNEEQYLADPTGARRFWPVLCGTIRYLELQRDRDQLWAEAVTRYMDNEPWYPERGDAEMLTAEQEERQEADPWEGKVASAARDGCTVEDILGALQLDIPKWDRGASSRVGHIMRRLGYKSKRITGTDGTRSRRYFKEGGLFS